MNRADLAQYALFMVLVLAATVPAGRYRHRLFTGLLFFMVLLVTGLSFLPALVLGPVAEYLTDPPAAGSPPAPG